MDIPTDLKLPAMYRVRQKLEVPVVEDIPAAIRQELDRIGLRNLVRPGMRIAVTAGSRGVANIPLIIATVVQRLKELGTQPFIVPAMGSHGGATPEGQVEVLRNLGITEERVRAPIISSLETVVIGQTPEGIPVNLDKNAAESDGILVVGRVKPHTDFEGPIESGLMKMMVIGLGKHKGALAAHRAAIAYGHRQVIPSVARVVLKEAPILCGLAVVENAYDQTAKVQAILPQDIEQQEMELLELAKRLLARIPYEQLDILIVDELGKDVSGAGMDTNVIGRIYNIASPSPDSPKIKRIFVRDLTEATHGNATGLGMADFTTRRCFEKIDYQSTYINCVTGGAPENARIPVICENDRQALVWALTTIGPVEPEEARMVWIKNTLEMENILVSQSLLGETQGNGKLEVVDGPLALQYDHDWNLVDVYKRRPFAHR